ncbi:MAG: hypothetical protein ACI4J0_00395 [Huintestinicola sp.]|uniref:hypothetical protein n=1 Tax=Huintestinicola sp. TaxID=2981661 RepID=UPI003F122BD9
MAYCTNCGGELFETSKFCPHCGTPVLEVAARSDDAKPKEYDTETASGDVEGLPEVNTGVLTPEEQAAVLEMAAENILEDIPDIKKLDSEPVSENKLEKTPEAPEEPEKQEIHKEEAPKPEPPKPAEETKIEKIPEPELISEPEPETVNIPAEPKKKGKGGIIAVIAILAIAAIGGAVFFLGQRSEPVNNVIEETELTVTEMTTMPEAETVPESEAVSETTEQSVASEAVTAAETELSSETAPTSETPAETEISAEETVSEEVSETVLSEATAAEGLHTADELAQGIVIEPEHQTAMGTGISAEISLSAEGIGTSILSSGVLFLAEYTSTASAPANLTPAAMVITIGTTPIEVTATSCSEGMVIFEYDVMTASVEAAGFTAADIDSVAIKSTGVPIDVFRITILQE